MNDFVENTPFVALVDDDQHSARLLTRMLLVHGSPAIQHIGGASDGLASLTTVLNSDANWPSLVIVDIKAHSDANLEFLTAFYPLARLKGIPVVIMMQPGHAERPLYDAGAAAVFIRHAELDAYRRETASIVSFWAQLQRLDAVGM